MKLCFCFFVSLNLASTKIKYGKRNLQILTLPPPSKSGENKIYHQLCLLRLKEDPCIINMSIWRWIKICDHQYIYIYPVLLWFITIILKFKTSKGIVFQVYIWLYICFDYSAISLYCVIKMHLITKVKTPNE